MTPKLYCIQADVCYPHRMITIHDNGNGTADVTIDSDTRTLPAIVREDAIAVHGIGVKNGRTSARIWKACATKWLKSGNIAVQLDGNFRHPSGNGLYVVGFWSDYAHQSQHSSQ